MTNSKKVQILSNNNYHLNQFSLQMFGEKIYVSYMESDGWTMRDIMKYNLAAINQTELDMINTEAELINLIQIKNNQK
tara:strand:+ start:186 stop:419 length:234 start_codon:yes stop_codon:yes gene_type:complete